MATPTAPEPALPPHDFIDPDDPDNRYCNNCGWNGNEGDECTGIAPPPRPCPCSLEPHSHW